MGGGSRRGWAECCAAAAAAALALALAGCATLDFLGDVGAGLGSTSQKVPQTVPAVRSLEYWARGTQSLKVDVFMPRDEASEPEALHPLVVHLHGGGWTMGARSTGPAHIDIPALTDHGYVVASMDYRLAPRDKFPAPVEDLDNALRFLSAHAAWLRIDTTRAALFGTSSGAHIAAVYVLEEAERDARRVSGERVGLPPPPIRIRAVIDMFGPADLGDLFTGIQGTAASSVFGPRAARDGSLVRASPAALAVPRAPPFLVIHGDRDQLVPYRQSVLLVQRLRAVGVTAELLIVHNAAHSLRQVSGPLTPSREAVTEMILAFLDRHLR
jgi:acetyl esterase/lipase